MNPIFNIDYDKLVEMLLPSRLRQTRTLGWLRVLIAPVVSLYARFDAYRQEKDYELAHNGQVCYLQKVLNDRFDPTGRGIVLVDTPDLDPEYYYLDAESKPEYMYLASENLPQYYRLEVETVGGDDFEVQVPNAISFDQDEMKALINKYKLVGRAYHITIV